MNKKYETLKKNVTTFFSSLSPPQTDHNQPSQCLCDTLKKPILIAVAVVTCIIIAVVVVVLVVR